MDNTNNQNEINVGVDTGKTQLDIYIRPLDIYFTVKNNDSGIKEAASLVGVAPFNRESGAYQGKRMIRGGRPKIRTAMYMAMMSDIHVILNLKRFTIEWLRLENLKK